MSFEYTNKSLAAIIQFANSCWEFVYCVLALLNGRNEKASSIHLPTRALRTCKVLMKERGLLRWRGDKGSACQCRRCKRYRFNPRVGKIPWSRKWQPASVFLAGKFHRQRSPPGPSSWVAKSRTGLSVHAHAWRKELGTGWLSICLYLP